MWHTFITRVGNRPFAARGHMVQNIGEQEPLGQRLAVQKPAKMTDTLLDKNNDVGLSCEFGLYFNS